MPDWYREVGTAEAILSDEQTGNWEICCDRNVAYLTNRFAGGRNTFERTHDIFKFSLLTAMLSTAVSATWGVTSLALGGFTHTTALFG